MGRYLRRDQQHHLPQGAGQCRDLLLLDRLRHGIRLRMAEIPHAPMRHFRRGQGAGDLSRHGKYLCRLRRGHPRVRREDLTPRGHGTAKIPLVPRPTAGILFDHTASRPPYPQLELYGQGGPMVPAPENIKTDHPVPPRLGMEPHGFPACPEMVWANTSQHLDVYAGYPPEDAYPEALHEPVEAPFSLLRLDKRIYSLLAPGEGEGHQLPEYSS